MNIVASDQMSIELTKLTEPAPIYNSAGKELGIFIPSSEIDYSNVVIPYSEEELDAARRESPGRPLSEIMNDLEP
jgi:hypothetical protein